MPDRRLYASAARLKPLRLGGVLARLGAVERLSLSPEGQTLDEMTRLLRWLHARGQRLFVLSLHSPSLEPGHTPYVRTQAELEGFLAALDGFLRVFTREFGGIPTDPVAVRDDLAARRAAA